MRIPKHKMAKEKRVRVGRTAKHKVPKAATTDLTAIDMETEETTSVTETNEVTPNTATPKTKEERAAIREKRKKANFDKNFYKIRNGNASGKHGPRAINRVSNG